MRLTLKGVALCVALVVNALFIGIASAGPLIFEYHGWHVDLTKAKGRESDQKMIDAVKRQLEIVEHVSLKPQVLEFTRTIKIWADPAAKNQSPGHYAHAAGVDLRVRKLDPNKPIILHELLHGYHDQVLPSGFGNPEIRTFYERGKKLWPEKSYMLKNACEYFAVTASVYLFGDIKRPPYSRAQIREKQPLYYKWLADLFDDGKPRS